MNDTTKQDSMIEQVQPAQPDVVDELKLELLAQIGGGADSGNFY
jgi:hypothetical protein